MKAIVEVNEKEGLEGLLGGKIAVWCCNYIYSGILIGVSDSEIKLTDASVVYETGPLGEEQFKLSEKLPSDWHVRKSAIESYGVMQ